MPAKTRTHLTAADRAGSIETVALISLGCPKNLVDSEKMLGLIAEAGLVPVTEDDDPDALIINTCGFLEASKQESLAELERAASQKKYGQLKRLIVAGCLVQRHRAKLLDFCPDIDALIGVFDRDRIVEAVTGHRDTCQDAGIELPVYSSIAANASVAKAHRKLEATGYYEDDAARLRLTPRHFAYLRVSEGCNQNCTFCTIPSIRGKMRSKPLENITAEARELIADGAFELNLIGQDTTSYGTDIGYAPGLTGLLETLDAEVSAAGGSSSAWIRLMYAYPSCFTDEMIDAIAALPQIVKYVDMPLQHINDELLAGMRRHTSRSLIESLLDRLRDRIPTLAIRTTFISGFPGETDDQHRELVNFVREFQFDHMGVFAYSPEPGTPAGAMHARGNGIDEQRVQQRIDELMTTQQQVVFGRHEEMAAQNRQLPVLIDEVPGGHAVGRIPSQAPDIDGVTKVRSRESLVPGELVPCRIIEADGYDLIAEPVRASNLPIL